jgi:HEAT repeat protein
MKWWRSRSGVVAWWPTIHVLAISVLGAVSTVGAGDLETEAWRNVVRALDPAERTSRILHIQNLVKTRARGVAKVLVYLAENEPDPDIKAEVTLGLMRLKDPTTEPALRRLRATLGDPTPLIVSGDLPESRVYQLQDPRDPSRIHIIAALYRITGDAELREQLLALLRSRNLPQAMSAAGVLSLLQEPRVLEELYQIVPDGDSMLACEIADSLLDEQNTPEVRRRLREAIKKRPVVGEPIQGQEIRETCIHGVLVRLKKAGKE